MSTKIYHKLKYNYSNEDLFEKTQNYQMSPFEGKEFLIEYNISRTETLKKIQDGQGDNLNEIIQNLYEKNNDKNSKIKSGFLTEHKFLTIILELNSKLSDDSEILINEIIKKFEVTKKIFFSYNEILKENSKDYQILRNYTLLSIICCKKYEKTNNLKFLNTLLKLNDTICSVFNKTMNEKDSMMISYVLTKEIKFINELKKRHKLK